MKNPYLTTIALLIAISVQSQNFIPLRIDSFYTWSSPTGFEEDTLDREYYAGYSYDSNDSLIQQRLPISIFNFSYGNDTVFLLSELLDTNGVWNIFSRSTTVYSNGKIASKLTQRFTNNNWVNSALQTRTYNSSGSETLYLLQHWDGSIWRNFYKKERYYDPNGNNIEEAEYYVDTNGDFDYNRGVLYEYDAANHRTQQITVVSSINGEQHFTGRINWAYGNDDLLDTIRRCQFTYPLPEIAKTLSCSLMTIWDRTQ